MIIPCGLSRSLNFEDSVSQEAQFNPWLSQTQQVQLWGWWGWFQSKISWLDMTGRCFRPFWMQPWGKWDWLSMDLGYSRKSRVSPGKEKKEIPCFTTTCFLLKWPWLGAMIRFRTSPCISNGLNKSCLSVVCVAMYPPKSLMFAMVQTTHFWFKGLWFRLFFLAGQSSDSKKFRLSQPGRSWNS